MVGGVILESVCRWYLNKGVDGREEVFIGVSGRVLVFDGSDFVIWNLKSYKSSYKIGEFVWFKEYLYFIIYWCIWI